MEKIKVKELVVGTGGSLITGDENREVVEVVIDSRQASFGKAFFPLIGENQDGHIYLKSAYDGGCRTFVVGEKYVETSWEKDSNYFEDSDFIVVEDTLKALQNLAKWYIRKFDFKKIAVTGSVGKTTTRDMIYHALKTKYKAGKNEKNYNSESGLPLTVLSFDGSYEAVVLEMGMDALGQIHDLADIARPDGAVITNIGISHIERLKTQDNIRKAKMEITDYFGEDNFLVVNGQDEILGNYNYPKSYRTILAGKDDYTIENLVDKGATGIEFTLCCGEKRLDVKLDLPGEHNAINLALAVASVKEFGIEEEEAIKGIMSMTLTGNRLAIKEFEGIKIIDDSYNAAPNSMISALRTLKNTEGKKKIAILAGMNELGSEEVAGHKSVGKEAANLGIDTLITIGEKGLIIREGAEEAGGNLNLVHYNSKEELYKDLHRYLNCGDVVLLKASRSYQLEKISEKIMKGEI